jgi:glycosyltransferase involved in cell wall biosynthesis
MCKTLLVIPHYNDTERLRPFLGNLMNKLPRHFSILVSDDGSSPHEQEKLTSLVHKLNSTSREQCGARLLPPIATSRNTGKGGAVCRGWGQSEGFSLLAFADADGAVSAEEIVRAESYFRSSECTADALFANRVKMLGRSIHRSFIRHFSGRVFATLVSELTNTPVYDSQCGLKILKADAYQKIQPYLSVQGFAFDVEVLLFLLKSGCRVIEFPVDWNDVEGSKVSLLRDSFRMAYQVLKIKNRVNRLPIHSPNN